MLDKQKNKGETSPLTIYTIGHSTREAEEFVKILYHYRITLVADVRSKPFSKYCPQFNKDIIQQKLIHSGIEYLFLGKELGARPEYKDYYVNNKVSFDKLKSSTSFKKGISRLIEEAKNKDIAIMCSEKEPVNCHRSILVSRVLEEEGIEVKHIINKTEILDRVDFEEKLLEKFKIQKTLFDTESSRKTNINEAYKKQEQIISYEEEIQEVTV